MDELEIRTDSSYVINGFDKLRHNRSHVFNESQDLWKFVMKLLDARVCEVFLTKVKGHATAKDVERGHVQAIDKLGNDAADALACDGADLHIVPEAISDDAAWRLSQAISMQRMFIAIMKARFDDHG